MISCTIDLILCHLSSQNNRRIVKRNHETKIGQTKRIFLLPVKGLPESRAKIVVFTVSVANFIYNFWWPKNWIVEFLKCVTSTQLLDNISKVGISIKKINIVGNTESNAVSHTQINIGIHICMHLLWRAKVVAKSLWNTYT